MIADNYSGQFILGGANSSAISNLVSPAVSSLSAQTALCSSASDSGPIAGPQAVIANYNPPCSNRNAPSTSDMSRIALPIEESDVSTTDATSMSSNETMGSYASSKLDVANGGRGSTAGDAAGGDSTATPTQASTSSTSSAGAAVGAMKVGSGSTLALVLAAVAMIVL